MEVLYSKLYEKYTKLKTRKNTESDGFNHDQEEKFINYVSTAEELIEHLKSENDELHGKIHDLTDEVASIRSEKEGILIQYEKLLNEETEKTKELTEEVERLRKLQEEKISYNSADGSNENAQLNSRRKRRISQAEAQIDEERPTSSASVPVEHSKVPETERDLCRSPLTNIDQNNQKGNCCTRNIPSSGNSTNPNCVFQTLVEFLVGMKFGVVTKTEGLCLSVFHQSSGYSFSLTWLSKADKEPTELLYHVLTLGTFERIAPNWMREDLVFSTSMCPIFFKRLSLVIGLHF